MGRQVGSFEIQSVRCVFNVIHPGEITKEFGKRKKIKEILASGIRFAHLIL